MSSSKTVLITAVTIAGLAVAGCATPDQQGPDRIRTPLDAMQSTPAPRSIDGTAGSGGLSSDVEQLKDARTTYKRARERRRARARRRQAHCHHAKNKKEVPIQESGHTNATFCEQTP